MLEAQKSKLSSKILNTLLWLEKKGAFYIPSSARSAEVYRKNLFPEMQDEQAMLDYLEGKFVMDIGSGTTHQNPYSLINVAGRNKERNITFLGIEPRVGTEEINNPINKVYLKYEIIGERLRRALKGDFDKLDDTPAAKSVVAGKADKLPVAKEKADIILSNYLVSYWEDETLLLNVMKEFYTTLADSGEIRLFPAKVDFVNRIENTQTELGKFMQDHFGIELSGIDDEQSAKRTLILRKKNNQE